MRTSARTCPSVGEIPGRSEAESALTSAVEVGRPSHSYAVLLIPEHLLRLAEAGDLLTADRALVAHCQSFIRALPAGARVYRWTATALVALAERSVLAQRYAGLGHVEVVPLAGMASVGQAVRELDFHVARNVAC